MSLHVVSFSGGIGSFWAAKRVIDAHGSDNVVLLFADTLVEDPDLYRFMREAAAYLGVEVTRIADGRTPWEVFADVGFLGNSRIDPCSRILKRELLWKWCEENAPGATVYLGIDWTEEHRLVRTQAKRPEWNIKAPMCQGELWTKDRMLAELAAIGIAIPELYTKGFAHNNCGGFCIKSGQAQFELLLREYPERYAEHERHEQDMRKALGKNVSILVDRRGLKPGEKRRPMTLKSFRERLESKPDFFDRHEWGGLWLRARLTFARFLWRAGCNGWPAFFVSQFRGKLQIYIALPRWRRAALG